jgi:NTE family protein
VQPDAVRAAASPRWPARRILLVAVDAESGEMHVFDRQSGVDLIDAVAAGCAGIVVLSPLGYDSPFPSPMPLRDVVGRLRSEDSAVTVITPDEASVAAMGINPLDPAARRNR